MTLLDLREFTTVAEAMAAIDAAEAIDYVPRMHFVDGGGAVTIYNDDVAYHDLGLLEAPGRRHRLYLDERGWDYRRE